MIPRCFVCKQYLCLCPSSIEEMLTSHGLADSDNRWGGASMEGHHFDSKGVENDAIKHEKNHYKIMKKATGFEYVDKKIAKDIEDDIADDQLSVELNQLDVEGFDHKKKNAIHFEADKAGKYKALLKKLKVKNT